MMTVTGLAAMNASFDSREVHCNATARMAAGAQWSAFGSVNGDGAEDAAEYMPFGGGGRRHDSHESHTMSWTY